jgi:hypothetical protein
VPPHPSDAEPHVFPEQACCCVSLVQHLLPLPHSWPVAHVLVQVIVSPQLFLTCPQATFAQAVVLSGVQHEVPLHSWFAPQVLVHVMVVPQLSLTCPHAMPLHDVVVGVQHALALHSWPLPQVLGQLTVSPQLFLTCPQATPLHVAAMSSGVQHALFLHS